jgi:hypothetical protein
MVCFSPTRRHAFFHRYETGLKRLNLRVLGYALGCTLEEYGDQKESET